MTRSKYAFSLVELSIVLVILGLLVGGVLSGQSLIHAAQLRKITTQYQNYQAAVNSFRDKYLALPGDMTNATKFWGQNPSSYCTNGVGTSSSDASQTLTCNGDGDGSIDGIQLFEAYTFWQQLANAGLIEGPYTGQVSINTTDQNPYGAGSACSCFNGKAGVTGPALAGQSGVGFQAQLQDASDIQFYTSLGNVFIAGRDNIDSNEGPFLTPTDLWDIDTKMDDGKPGSGNIVGTTRTCGSGLTSSAATATYLLSSTATSCFFTGKM